MMISPWDRWYSTSCCLCCHVRTGTIILGVWYMLINAVVLLILLTALGDPEQYHLTSAELANDLDIMDDTNMCIASAISMLMILICGMAAYGAYKLHAAWIIPFFCYQIFDFGLNTLVAVSTVVYPNTIQDYLQQLPDNFPYKEEIAALSNVCLVLIVLLFISCILCFKWAKYSVIVIMLAMATALHFNYLCPPCSVSWYEFVQYDREFHGVFSVESVLCGEHSMMELHGRPQYINRFLRRLLKRQRCPKP